MAVASRKCPSRALRAFDRRLLRERGLRLLAGVDEAGRGALAGPLTAGAVLVDAAFRVERLNDSKRLSPALREELAGEIRAQARAAAVGWASAEEIDRLNVLRATHLAAARALAALGAEADLILTDWLRLADAPAPVEALVKGDATSQAVAGASVLAKVARDERMRELDAEYPDYGFALHKGYGVATHLEALRERGASTVHRRTFKGVCFFDVEPRPSRTLDAMLAELRDGRIEAHGWEAVWRERAGERLPLCERETLRRAAFGLRGAAP